MVVSKRMNTNDAGGCGEQCHNLVLCQSNEGFELRGSVLRLEPHLVAFEVYHADLVVQLSEVLAPFRVLFDGTSVYSGRAVITNVVRTGGTLVCEATLDNGGFDANFFAAVGKVEVLRDRFHSFMRAWEQTYRIGPKYKIGVADLQTYLMSLRQWLEQTELGFRSRPPGDRLRLEKEALEELGKAIVPVINRFFEEFEVVAPSIEPDRLSAHRAYLKRHLHPLVLCSPFAYRTFTKPLGYAGDYEMVNMMTRSPFEGGSLFAKIVNLWFLEQPPAEAHRNRVSYLQRVLLQETARVLSAGGRTRILNLACGPAVEVQRWMAETPLADRARFDLLDFNEETLLHVRRVLEEVKHQYGRSTSLTYIKRSVSQLLKQSAKIVERMPERQYDLIYCAGLFDYLTDTVCHRLMTLFYTWLAPGGLLLVTNVDPSNPLRYGMEHLLDWHLIYRNASQLRALRPSQVLTEDANVKSEVTGVDLFLEVRRNQHA
jgi:extracellular factor (EF) 3-hydroxypalmitic acid methyl ester biosynthesis protein